MDSIHRDDTRLVVPLQFGENAKTPKLSKEVVDRLRPSGGIITWAEENRVIRDLTPEECVRFRLCEAEPEIPLAPASSPNIMLSALPTATPLFDTSDTQIAVIGENRGWVRPGELVDAGRAVPSIDFGGDQAWVYQGQAGEHLTIDVIADNPGEFIASDTAVLNAIQNGLLVPHVRLYDPLGHFLVDDSFTSPNDLNTRIEDYELPVDGRYRIEVSGLGYFTGGDYTMIITSDREQEE